METIDQIETRIVAALAAQKRCTPDELRADLQSKGNDMPEDSHRLVRVVFRLQRELGIPRFAWNKELKPAFKSVRGMAELLHSRQPQREAAA
jgi:hypothetical protein